MDIPFSPAADRNKDPILEVLKEHVEDSDRTVLEIGAGTGQHAVYFASHFPHLMWVATEQAENLAMLNAGVASQAQKNLAPAQSFKVGADKWPPFDFDIAYTANTFHIMSQKECDSLIAQAGENLKAGARFIVYGPFNYGGKYTSPSNENFDKTYLRLNFPKGGIKNFEDIQSAFNAAGFELVKDHEMPANNRILVFTRL